MINRLPKYVSIVILVVFLFPHPSYTQHAEGFHDLRSMTDYKGDVNLFYRIFNSFGPNGDDYYANDVYVLNTTTGEEEFFLEDFYSYRYGFELRNELIQYRIINHKISQTISVRWFDEEFGEIWRNDSLVFEALGYIPEDLLVAQKTPMVYVSFNAEYYYLKSFDYGYTWPSRYELQTGTYPDSLNMKFPVQVISPLNDSLMFGYDWRDSNSGFMRSLDAGLTTEHVSFEYYPNNEAMGFDIDSLHVYMVDYVVGDSTYPYQLVTSHQRGKSGTWRVKQSMKSPAHVVASDEVSGEVILWDKDRVLRSQDYGDNFETFIQAPQGKEITGFTLEGKEYFLSTPEEVYRFKDGRLETLRSIPVSMEENDPSAPSSIELLQNYPNPFNPVTTIKYTLSEPTNVRIEVYNIMGQRVMELEQGQKPAGSHRVLFDGSQNPSGIYLIKLTTSHESRMIKSTLIK